MANIQARHQLVGLQPTTGGHTGTRRSNITARGSQCVVGSDLLLGIRCKHGVGTYTIYNMNSTYVTIKIYKTIKYKNGAIKNIFIYNYVL